VFIWTFGDGPSDYLYGFPAIDGAGGGLKVASDQFEATTTPDQVERKVGEAESAEFYERCVHGRLPAVLPGALRSSACMFTVTPDFRFVIDEHPLDRQVLIVSRCSGHGFKHSAGIGEAFAQFLLIGASAADLSVFGLNRFGPGVTAPARDKSLDTRFVADQ